MIVGIGIDIVEIDRISRAIMKNSAFVQRFFTENEQDYFKERNNRYEVIAGNFAAKEAFSKALGTGIRNFTLKDVEVLRDPVGKPYINLFNNAFAVMQELEISKIHVSISHCRQYAAANVIAERE
ncbi:holo-ACP synthase [Petroclostridium sp. X23]|uniref:holo-ACP synthase n=1 Tax=Petroclostridium sp. X23 TaxID=3045146 RepID=UPI0024AE79FC|nr:holo-ACP synthase [Petroclostridium sp. X23]WHH61748.1 holo-ACP synthase [Petroclostridium sp. X23]